MWVAIALLTTAAFAAGMGTGVLVDGNAEVLNSFNRHASRICPPTQPAEATIVTPKTAPGDPPTPVPAHPNNAVTWAIAVAPGTETAPLEVRNGDPTHGVAIAFLQNPDGTPHPIATLWVSPGSMAHLSLPEGGYSASIQRLDAGEGAYGPPTDLGQPFVVTSSTSSHVMLAGTADGSWQATSTSAAKDPIPRRRHARQSDRGEYEGLGRSETTGGTRTYSPDE
jgi:hypothetical protein